jgi:hypothetical protein
MSHCSVFKGRAEEGASEGNEIGVDVVAASSRHHLAAEIPDQTHNEL